MAATKAVHLYPPDHPARLQPLRKTAQILEEFLKSAPAFYIAHEEGILVVQGTGFVDRFPSMAECLDRFLERKIKRIEFQKGMNLDDLKGVIELLSLPPEGLKGFPTVGDFLRKVGAFHVQVEMEEEDLKKKAYRTYTEAKSYIVQFWNEARLGRLPEGEKARTLVTDLSQILEQDPNALLGLTLLSDYDNYTFNHSVNVGIFALSLAEELGYKKEKLSIGLGGLLHDVGKTRIPLEVINKPGKLTDEEWELMKLHPIYSAEIVTQMKLNDIYDVVYQHHCGFDRRGYPQLPPSKELNEGAMITSVCDVYDSVTTLRPYQRQHTPQEGIAVLLKLKNKGQLRPEYVDTFIRMLGIYPVGTTVRLNTGEIGVVVETHRDAEDRPRLKIVRDARGNLLRIPEELDLREEGRKHIRIVGTLDPFSVGIKISDYVEGMGGEKR